MSARRKSTAPIIQANKTQRNPLNNFNIKSETLRNDAKGTKPTCEAASVKDVLIMALLHICKKTIFFDVRLKVALYLASLFLISIIGGEFNQLINQVNSLNLLFLQILALTQNHTFRDQTISSMFTLSRLDGSGRCSCHRRFFISQTSHCAAEIFKSFSNIMYQDLSSQHFSGTVGQVSSMSLRILMDDAT